MEISFVEWYELSDFYASSVGHWNLGEFDIILECVKTRCVERFQTFFYPDVGDIARIIIFRSNYTERASNLCVTVYQNDYSKIDVETLYDIAWTRFFPF